jgi:carboxymethylenebutenolidase
MGKRLAGEGYAVLTVNPYYRVGKGTLLDTKTFNFQTDRAKLDAADGLDHGRRRRREGRGGVRGVARHAEAGQRLEEDRHAGLLHGRPLVMRTSARVANRIGAGASFHGGGLVTQNAEQPAPAGAQDQGQDVLRRRQQRRHAAADGEGHARRRRSRRPKNPAKIEVYPTRSTAGACPDMPVAGRRAPIYNQADAERAWGELLALYKAALAVDLGCHLRVRRCRSGDGSDRLAR